MYKITVKTKYNTVELLADDPEHYREFCEQPYVEKVDIEELATIESLEAEKAKLLMHVTGMPYRLEQVKRLTREIERIQNDGRGKGR